MKGLSCFVGVCLWFLFSLQKDAFSLEDTSGSTSFWLFLAHRSWLCFWMFSFGVCLLGFSLWLSVRWSPLFWCQYLLVVCWLLLDSHLWVSVWFGPWLFYIACSWLPFLKSFTPGLITFRWENQQSCGHLYLVKIFKVLQTLKTVLYPLCRPQASSRSVLDFWENFSFAPFLLPILYPNISILFLFCLCKISWFAFYFYCL